MHRRNYSKNAGVKMIFPWLVDSVEKAFELPKFNTFKEFLQHGFNLNKEDVLSTFKIEFSPWLNTVADWLDDYETEWINLAQATQTAKTTLPMGFLLYASQKEPVRFLWTQSTEEEAKQFITDRLKPYIEDYSSEAITKKSWRIEAFKVFKARVKIGFASNEQSLRQTPAKYVVGDECSIWKASISVVKKRTRTFEGRGRKGIFVTTPPKDPNHHSWKEFCQANFYRWYVECPKCGDSQPLVMSGLKFEGRDGKGWDYQRVKESTRYQCRRCKDLWHDETQKLSIINTGRAVCVDPENGYREKAEQKGNTAKTLQISALYSVFTPWGETACNFLQAKHAGGETFKNFITDELAEVPIDLDSTESLQDEVLARFVDYSRKSGFTTGYDVYTGGVDVQRNGELYCSVYGWKSGVIPTGHLLLHGCVSWQGGNFQQKWANLLHFFAPFQSHLARVAIDATDGLVSQDIYDFCNYAGRPYIALKDSTTLHLKTCIKTIIPEMNGKKINKPQLVLLANSDKIKDDIASSFQRAPGEVGAWSFPGDVSGEFLKALTTEHRTTDKRGKSSWCLKYSHAPNHYFSTMVYGCAAMEEFRIILQAGIKKAAEQLQPRPRVASGGINVWR